ncbi:hypothetical protein DSM104443_00656 [Usitatibacter rugosus]|uniref:DUF3025 domain-containing protein n=1 Tax=Usitatibacter rugosus TaxID=2732067 RepID=A0A6M4GVD0_9PROT|nr:DUF3025 domain-containing protein [Usitatibacter rugosus]QJR09607.1 hypothetical protein DSM104443_00656 [Usitatibacter rugosus]
MEWTAARAALRNPAFAPLAPALALLPTDRWPTHAELTELAHGIVTSRGKALQFIAPRGHTDRERRYYELHIADTGEVETRPENWHDLFNALSWIAFPKSKAAINAQHAAILEERGEEEAKRRSPERDALTLFDEGGVIVASSDARVFERIRGFAWKELFWGERVGLAKTTRFVAFGHNLFEKMLDPHLGIVAKTVFVPLAESFDADEALAAHFATRANFTSPKAMAPMPVLGIPGWHPGTETEVYYDDKDQFRGSRPRP